MFCVMFYQFYSASIVAALLLTAPKTILTLKALLDSSLEIGMNPKPFLYDWMSVKRQIYFAIILPIFLMQIIFFRKLQIQLKVKFISTKFYGMENIYQIILQQMMQLQRLTQGDLQYWTKQILLLDWRKKCFLNGQNVNIQL